MTTSHRSLRFLTFLTTMGLLLLGPVTIASNPAAAEGSGGREACVASGGVWVTPHSPTGSAGGARCDYSEQACTAANGVWTPGNAPEALGSCDTSAVGEGSGHDSSGKIHGKEACSAIGGLWVTPHSGGTPGGGAECVVTEKTACTAAGGTWAPMATADSDEAEKAGGHETATEWTCTLPLPALAPTQTPIPMWMQAHGRTSATESCGDGWDPSWHQWMNGGTGGFVCTHTIPALGE